MSGRTLASWQAEANGTRWTRDCASGSLQRPTSRAAERKEVGLAEVACTWAQSPSATRKGAASGAEPQIDIPDELERALTRWIPHCARASAKVCESAAEHYL